MFGKKKDGDEDGPFIFGNEPDDDSTEAEVSGEIDWTEDIEEPEEEDLEDEEETFQQISKEEVEREIFSDEWDEPKPTARPQPVVPPRVQTVKPKEKVTMTNQPRPIPRRTGSQMDFDTALKIVEMKFQFWKYLGTYLVGGAILFIINLLLNRYAYEMQWWFVFPLLVYGLFLIFPFFRAYLFKGQDIHSMLQGKLHRMAEKEIERTEIYEE